jgi:hypothetical protein
MKSKDPRRLREIDEDEKWSFETDKAEPDEKYNRSIINIRRRKKMLKNKKGFVWLIVLILGLAVAVSVLGIVFVGKVVDNLNSITATKSSWIVAGLILLIVFRNFVQALLMSILGWLKSI